MRFLLALLLVFQTVLPSYAATTGKVVQADNIDGLKTNKNFLKNGLAQVNEAGWATYADAAASRPVDGTGGSPSITWGVSTTAPLSDARSFILTKDAVNRQGQGVSTDFTIDNAQKAKMIKVEFDYIVNSGTFAAGSSTTDSDMIVYLYDVTNSRLIEPSTFKLYTSSTTLPDKYQGYFQTSPDSTSYRLIFHVATTSASAWALKIDNVAVSPSEYVAGTIITDWVSYTPTLQSTGTAPTIGNGNISGRWRRVGGSAEIQAKAYRGNTGGTAGTGIYFLTIPSGLSLDSTKITDNNNVGTAFVLDGGVATYVGIAYIGTNGIGLAINNSNNLVGQNIPSADWWTSAGDNSLSVNISIPILGWSAGAQMSDGYDGRVIAFAIQNSSSFTVPANSYAAPIKVTNFSSSVLDTVGGFNSNTYTARTAGLYKISFAVGTGNSASSKSIVIYKNGSPTLRVDGAVVVYATISGAHILQLNAGDYVDLYAGSNHTSSENYIVQMYTIEKLSGSAFMSPTETVGALYTGAPPTGTLNSSFNVVTFGTKVVDTHGLYSGGIVKIQESGFYDIKSQVALTGTFSSATFGSLMAIEINGSVAYRGPFSIAGSSGSLSGYPVIAVDFIPLKAGDLVKILVATDGTGAAYSTDGSRNSFSIKKVK